MSLEKQMKTGQVHVEFGHSDPADIAYEKVTEDQRLLAKDLCYDYNNTRPTDIKSREEILKKLLGAAGEAMYMENGEIETKNIRSAEDMIDCIRKLLAYLGAEIVEEEEITSKSIQRTGAGKIKMSKSFKVSPEINLLGQTVDEALSVLDKYLDDAYLAHLPSVRVVHGKGTGALRQGVHNFLRRSSYVESYRLGEVGEGDAGVTIVTFKK